MGKLGRIPDGVKHIYTVDGFSCVNAISSAGGMIQSQNVQTLLSHDLLLELRALRKELPRPRIT